MLLFCIFILLMYTWNRPRIQVIKDPDIILSPGGLLGFYVLGISHFIKKNYNMKSKKIIGFSAGALNSIFLSMDKKHDDLFLTKLFQLNLHGRMSLPYILKKTIHLMNSILHIDMFDTKDKYIAVTTDYSRLVGYDQFLNIKDMTDCCISSSFIPFVTYYDLFYFYKGKCCMDGGLLYPHYKRSMKGKHILYLNYTLFKRFNRYHIPGYGLLKKNYSIYELYTLGYSDATQNKSILDAYF